MKFYKPIGIGLLSLCLMSGSCKKSEEKRAEPNKINAPVVNVGPNKPNELNKSVLENKVEIAPLDIKLPRPIFSGTPPNLKKYNVEDTTGKNPPVFYAPKGTENLALGKPVSGSDDEPVIGEIEYITDGDKEGIDGSYVELGPFRQHVQIDLGSKNKLYAIVVWHYHKQARVYRDVIVQVADDPNFILNVKTLFNNDHDNSSGLGVGTDREYVDNNNGKLIDAKGVQARYVRFYSNGHTNNELNHYIEVEVYGRPIEKK